MNGKPKPAKFGLLGLLLFITILARIGPLAFGTLPFTFDHGKDAIAVLHMVKTFSPKLIGPWTSIPGLFFGPAWYYLLSPGIWLFNASPLAPSVTMVILGLIQVILLYRYFGFTAGFLGAISSSWISGSTSAWNPYPMSLVLLILLILLNKLKSSKNPKYVFGAIGLVVSFGFHFSSAFAISFLISIPMILFIKYRKRITKLHLVFLVIGFIIPFLPQLLFETRHSFIETKSVINYLVNTQNQTKNPSGISPLRSVIDLVNSTVAPSFPGYPKILSIMTVVVTMMFGIGIFQQIKLRQLPRYFIEGLLLFFPALIIFSLTHFNTWYWFALVSVITVIAASIIDNFRYGLKYVYYLVFIVGLGFNLLFFYQIDRYKLSERNDFLPAKLKTLNFVYQTANGRPFASYQYAAHIYDFDWQYLYFWKALNGYSLPTEFSYKPKEISYIPEKQELLAKYDSDSNLDPEIIFYIVEKPQNQNYLDLWWGDQKYDSIIGEEKISPYITVYMANPIKNVEL